MKGKQLSEFVKTKEKEQERETLLQREREEREVREREREVEALRQREDRELEDRRQREERQFQLEMARLQHAGPLPNGDNAIRQGDNKSPRLPAFVDGKDKIDSFLSRFERYAEDAKWDRRRWASQLSALLTGDALDVYTRMNNEDARDYDKLRDALLKWYQFNEKGYRKRFRECRPEVGESPDQFVERLRSYLSKWFEFTGDEKNFENICSLIVKEQFLNACPKDVAIHLEIQKSQKLEDITDTAERYLIANNRTLMSSKPPKSFLNSNNESNDSSDARLRSDKLCWYCEKPGHRAVDCPSSSAIGRKDRQRRNGSTYGREFSGSMNSRYKKYQGGYGEQKAGVAVILPSEYKKPVSSEDINECIEDGQLKLANGKTVSVVTCAADVGNQNMPVTKGLVGNHVVDVLRDSGCNGSIIRSDLVTEDQLTGEFKWAAMADCRLKRVPVAKIRVDTPFFRGEVKATCFETPLYDFMLGNVEGARSADNPDPEWRPNVTTSTRIVEEKKNEEEVSQEGLTEEKVAKEEDEDPLPFPEGDIPIPTCAVITRGQKMRNEITTPLKVADNSRAVIVDKDKLVELQQADKSVDKLRDKKDKKAKGKGEVYFEEKSKVLYRIFQHPAVNDGKPLRQVIVPTPLRRQVMVVAHDSIMGGHLGIKKTTDRILAAFYWPGIHGDVTRFCRSCDSCQKTIPRGNVRKVPLQKMPLIDRPFKRVAIDLIGEINPPSKEGHRWVLTLVDYTTRYPEAVPLKKIDTETVAEALVDIFSRLGVPEEILTDMGTQFVSKCMEEVNRMLSIRHLTTTPYHPMCNGLVEKFNGTLKQMLKKMCSEQPRQWHRYINALLFAYREVPQESTGFSPFELLYGRTVRGPMHILKELWTTEVDAPDVKNSYQYVFELREKLERTLEIARRSLEKSQEIGKHYYDRKTKIRKFRPKDKVLVLLPTDHNKLLMQWKGPYEVESVVGLNDYSVMMGKKLKTYHANLLKYYSERVPDTVQVGGAILQEIPEEEFDTEDLLGLGDVISKEGPEDVKMGLKLSGEQLKDLSGFVDEFSHRFRDTPGTSSLIEHEVNLTSEVPVYSKPYPISYKARESLKKDIGDMLKMGVIRESKSPYASPVVVTSKRDGTNRVCLDFRKINKITVFDPEPMPAADDLFHQLSGSKIFSKIDLCKGYWQIPMREKDIPKTGFVTPDGTYECLKMPFGMVNSGATLKRGMRAMLKDMNNVVCYWDDLLVHTVSWEEHMKTLKELFQRLTEADLTVRPSKCTLGTDDIEFIGHSLKNGQKGLLEENVAKIQNAPRPTTKKQIRSFLGLAGYYREYCPNFAAITVPLSDLTKKGCPNNVRWGPSQEKAYQTVRDMLSKDPVLRLPDPAKEYVLRTDASDDGLGAVLMQEHEGKFHPVVYASKKLLKAEKNYSTIEKECLAMIWGIRKFERYLQGVKFRLQTDHRPLTHMNTAKFVNSRIMRWAMYLQNFDMTVESIKGTDNIGADFLSRVC